MLTISISDAFSAGEKGFGDDDAGMAVAVRKAGHCAHLDIAARQDLYRQGDGIGFDADGGDIVL